MKLLKSLPLLLADAVGSSEALEEHLCCVMVTAQTTDMGLRILVATPMAHPKSLASRHSGGKKLYDLDTGAPSGDACLALEDSPAKTAAVSAVLDAAIMNAATVETIQYLLDSGHEPPVLMSANLDGSDELNARVMARCERHPISKLGIHGS